MFRRTGVLFCQLAVLFEQNAALGCTFAQAQNTKELSAVYFAEPVFEQVSFGSDDAQLLKMETPGGGDVINAKEFAQALTPIQEEAISEQFEMKAILEASTPIQEEAIGEQFEMKAILDAVKDTPSLAIIIRNRELLISDCSNNAIIDRYELSNVEERESKTILTTAGGDEFVLETTAGGRFLTKTKGKSNLPFDKMRIIR